MPAIAGAGQGARTSSIFWVRSAMFFKNYFNIAHTAMASTSVVISALEGTVAASRPPPLKFRKHSAKIARIEDRGITLSDTAHLATPLGGVH